MNSPISVGHDTLTVSSTAVGLNSGARGIYAGGGKRRIFTDQDIRIWLDGTSPTTTSGLLVYGVLDL
jgi:hypothetical protein